MTKGKMIIAAVALSLLGSTAALADNDHWKNDHPDNHGKQVSERAHARNEARKEARWERGHSWPSQYRSKRYIVTDWHGHHLRKPPRGYRWYRADNNYVLVRTKTNVISDIINALD